VAFGGRRDRGGAVRQFRYPIRTLLLDDAKAVIGLIISAGPLFLDDLSRFWLYVFSVLTVLFLVFAIRTAIRHTRVLELSEKGIRMRGFNARGFVWEALESVQLRYYSTRRDHERGWMSLKLKGGGSTVAVDSSIAGFEDIARQVADVARQREIELSPASWTNFDAMGIGRTE